MIMSESEAKKNGYRPVTEPYADEEMFLAYKVVADMDKGNIPHVFVKEEGGQSIWRK